MSLERLYAWVNAASNDPHGNSIETVEILSDARIKEWLDTKNKRTNDRAQEILNRLRREAERLRREAEEERNRLRRDRKRKPKENNSARVTNRRRTRLRY